jgi:hypothetical protein
VTLDVRFGSHCRNDPPGWRVRNTLPRKWSHELAFRPQPVASPPR